MILDGAVALISGGRRLGAEVARALAARGCHVVFSYLSQAEPVEAAAADCRRLGVRAAVIQADLRDQVAIDRLVRQVIADFGRIDILLNLTSTYRPTPLISLTPAECDELLDSNLRAPLLTAVTVARQMLSQPIRGGLRGKIVHYTDWSIDRPYRDFLPYIVGKGGLSTLTKALAVELAPTITVNSIAPGTMLPPPDLSPERRAAIAASSTLERLGTPAEIVEATMFVLQSGDFMTGETLRVDGGRFLGRVGDVLADHDA